MDNIKGSLLMVAAMAGFALEDMLVKAAAQDLPVGQVLIVFGFGGMAIYASIALIRGEALLHPQAFSRPLLARAFFEILGRLGYTVAIALTPLSSASAILQAAPLVVATGAVMVFGEKVGWRRWLAIIIGFIGVLMILRPGTGGFEPLSVFAVLGMIGFAGRDLATRAAPPSMTNAQLGLYGFAMMAIAGAVALSWTGGATLPDGQSSLLLGGAIVMGVLGYSCLTGAMRTGEIGVVAPFRYIRLVFAMILGVLVFAERPDAMTLLGSAVIVASGLYTVFRGQRAKA